MKPQYKVWLNDYVFARREQKRSGTGTIVTKYFWLNEEDYDRLTSAMRDIMLFETWFVGIANGMPRKSDCEYAEFAIGPWKYWFSFPNGGEAGLEVLSYLIGTLEFSVIDYVLFEESVYDKLAAPPDD